MPAVLVAHPWLFGGGWLFVLIVAAMWYSRRPSRPTCDLFERPEYEAFLYALLTKRRWRSR